MQGRKQRHKHIKSVNTENVSSKSWARQKRAKRFALRRNKRKATPNGQTLRKIIPSTVSKDGFITKIFKSV